MRIYFLSLFMVLLTILSLKGQPTLTGSSQINTVCNGFGCNYNGPSILINEVMIRPTTGNGSIAGNNATQRAEWIELYNPDLCKPVDISCYFLGNRSPDGTPTQYYGGGFELPQGTVVPPRGFVIVRGVNAAAVPANLLVQNGGRTLEVVVTPGSSSVCYGGGSRLWFPDAGGWFAFYDQNGVPQDAITWNNPNAQALSGSPCNPPGNCPFTGTLASYNNIPANRKTQIFNGTPSIGLSIRRFPDGGNWAVNSQAAATYGTCNTVCAPPPVITCNGSATVNVSGGTPPYTYLWDDGQTQMTATASGLCAGTYCVTVTDAGGLSATTCVTVNDFEPIVEMSPIPDMCIDAGAVNLTQGSPPGGYYSGSGVFTDVFLPAAAGTGTHTIKYIYYTADSCMSLDSTDITVFPAPNVFLPPLPSLCSGIPPLPLNTGFPAGGTYSGTGVIGNTFDPSVSGNGTFPITYILANAYGCDDTAVSNITVYPAPAVNLQPFAGICVNAPPLPLSGGTPAGGTYSGPGVTGNVFNPSAVGSGSFNITYSYTDMFNCQGSNTQPIQVFNLPSVTFLPPAPVCVNSAPVVISGGSPAGGTYSGPGLSGGLFNPAITGPGTFTLTYSYTDNNGCTAASGQSITVFPVPAVNLANLASLCVNAGIVSLTGGSPPGGTYSGTAVTNGNFNTLISGTGTFAITYSYTDPNGCTNAATQNLTVHDLPLVSLDPLADVCLNASPLTLSGGLPAGGTYSGTAVSGSEFDPASAGAGTHVISYTWQDGNGCSNTAFQNINVLNLPLVQFSPLSDLCLNSDPAVLSGGTPVGGTYAGNGVLAGSFDPSVTGVGSFQLEYMYTDANGCTDTALQTITVRPLPAVSLQNLPDVCLNDPPVNLSGGSPAGGTYSGPGVLANSFDPAVTGAGIFNLFYTYTDAYNCSNTDSSTLTVNTLPEVFSVTGGGIVCEGSGGSPVGLSGSESGVEYRLLINGVFYGFPFSGSGDSLSLGKFETAGYYTVIASNLATGCYAKMGDSVQISTMPRPAVDLGDTLYLCDIPELQLDAGTGTDTLTYEWQNGSSEQYYIVTEPGVYWVKVGLGSCFNTDSVMVAECSELEIPNVFTPNDDQKNDRFKPRVKGEILDYNVNIFNRWGKQVYTSDDLEEGWDGTLENKGSPCADGTYFFVITYRAFAYPQPPIDRKVSGTVTLLR
ncbi:MAG TPA: gliding motility-associated C-terminal domain-containing protein [Bacteroidales bacterium]|nr:gliding motility-associated C-terminal domain-containing protein [Bacteroidales bacterium]HSA43973.1 gliding motility-associated C-terminal domain-containing protein [Bacteroidales bacterium]